MKYLVKRGFYMAVFCMMTCSTAFAGVVFMIGSEETRTGEPIYDSKISVQGRNLKMTIMSRHETGETESGGSEQTETGTSEDAGAAVNSSIVSAAESALTAAQAGSHSQPEDTGPQDTDVIFRGDRRELIVVDHSAERYFVINEQFLETLHQPATAPVSAVDPMLERAYQAALAQIESQNLTDEQRALAEKTLRDSLGMSGALASPGGSVDPSNWVNANQHDTVAGYPSEKWEKQISGIPVEDMWVTDWSNLGPGAQARETIEDWLRFMSGLASVNSGASASGLVDSADALLVINEIGKFPVSGSSLEDEERFLLESVTERDLDPDAFEPPRGYLLRTMGPQNTD